MTDDRDEFVRHYAPLVAKVVGHTRVQLRISEEVEDLTAYGYEGLLQAKERWKPENNVPFPSFAYYRIRGAVIDGVRRSGKLTRRGHAWVTAAAAVDELAEPVSEAPRRRDPEAAVRGIDQILGGMATAYYAALASDAGDDGSPEAAALARERAELLGRALSALPDHERRLVQGHYLEGRPLDEVIAELGYARSWGRSLHNRALGTLREALASA